MVRPPSSSKYGGAPTYNQWFRGEVSYFGGIEYAIPKWKGASLKLEYDPFNYFDFSANNRIDAEQKLRVKKESINIGLNLPINDYFTFGAAFFKGNAFNITFNAKVSLNEKLFPKKKFNPRIDSKANNDQNKKDSFYLSILQNLNDNQLLLQTAELKNNKLNIAISTSQHRNAIRSSSRAAYITKKISDAQNIDINLISVTHLNAGIEQNKISFVANHIDNNLVPYEVKKNYTKIYPGTPGGFKNNEFQPRVDFPVFFSSTSPSLINHIGNPEKFIFAGLNIQNISEIQFRRNILLSSEINLPVYNNFRDTVAGPGSEMEHVRTDLVEYLKNDDLYVSRMQIDYIFSPYKEVYAKLSTGIFETMYGGIGGEILYKPFNKNFTVGANLFYVKQRSFKQNFEFRDYKTTTGHLSLGYMFPMSIEAVLSVGRYLAKDDGYTLDLSRRTPSGFKAGIYFTRTNVSKKLFGEGSFDKGFYFQIPLDLFSNEYDGNYSSFKLSPLTRDGGAKLSYEKELRGLMSNSAMYEFIDQWNGLLN